MGPQYFWGNGIWIFPVIMLIVMLFIVFLIFGHGSLRPPWWYDSKYHNEDKGHEASLEILKKRYAKGEISKEQFEQMKKDILN